MVAKRIHCLVGLPVWAALVWAVILIGPTNGATIRVPQDYSTINEAINYAWAGDEIVVSPGVYVENVNFRGRSFVLRSTNPTDTATVAATILDGGRNGPVVTFLGSERSGWRQ